MVGAHADLVARALARGPAVTLVQNPSWSEGIGSSVRAGKQFADLFEPVAGAHYPLEPGDIVRLGADVRAFLSNRREAFRAYSASM